MGIFHCYVSLPEGIYIAFLDAAAISLSLGTASFDSTTKESLQKMLETNEHGFNMVYIQ